MRSRFAIASAVFASACLALAGCGDKPAPAPVAAPAPAPVAPAPKPTLPYGPEAQKAAIDRAAAFAQSRYPDKLNLSDAIAVYEAAPPPAPPPGAAPGSRPPGPPPVTGPGLPPPPPPSQAERDAMLSGTAPKGEIPIAPPPSTLPTVAPAHGPKGSWRIMFRLIKPISADPSTPPITVRVFSVDGGGKVGELEPMTIPLNQLSAAHPTTP
jgi:hypothetical protein